MTSGLRADVTMMFEQPHVSIDMAIELATQVQGLAKEHGVKLRAYDVSKDHMEAVKAHRGVLGDIAGIYGAVRQESGLPYEIDNPKPPSG